MSCVAVCHHLQAAVSNYLQYFIPLFCCSENSSDGGSGVKELPKENAALEPEERQSQPAAGLCRQCRPGVEHGLGGVMTSLAESDRFTRQWQETGRSQCWCWYQTFCYNDRPETCEWKRCIYWKNVDTEDRMNKWKKKLVLNYFWQKKAVNYDTHVGILWDDSLFKDLNMSELLWKELNLWFVLRVTVNLDLCSTDTQQVSYINIITSVKTVLFSWPYIELFISTEEAGLPPPNLSMVPQWTNQVVFFFATNIPCVLSICKSPQS